MDHAAYHIVYVDNRANGDLDGKYIHKTRVGPLDGADWENKDSRDSRSSEYVEMILPQVEEVRNNISSILTHFDGGMSFCAHAKPDFRPKAYAFRCPWSDADVV